MFKILNKKTITFVIFSRANYNSIKSVIDEVKNKKDLLIKLLSELPQLEKNLEIS